MNMAPYITIQPFDEEYSNEVSQLYRKFFFRNVYILKQSLKAPGFFVLTGCFVVILSLVFDDILTIVIGSTVLSSSSVVVIFRFHEFRRERYDGSIYPKKLLRLKNGTFFVAVHANVIPRRVVGTIGVEPLNRETAKINLVCVHPNYRGTGIGRRLFTEAITFSKDAGFKSVRTHIWDVGSNRSLRDALERRNFHYVTWFFAPTSFLPLVVGKVYEKKLI